MSLVTSGRDTGVMLDSNLRDTRGMKDSHPQEETQEECRTRNLRERHWGNAGLATSGTHGECRTCTLRKRHRWNAGLAPSGRDTGGMLDSQPQEQTHEECRTRNLRERHWRMLDSQPQGETQGECWTRDLRERHMGNAGLATLGRDTRGFLTPKQFLFSYECYEFFFP